MATQNAQTEFKSIQDCPEFLRKLVANRVGVSLETVNTWLDTNDAEGIAVFKDAVLKLDDAVKQLRQSEAAQGGAS